MKAVHVSGKRKTAIARATMSDGIGNIRINKQMLETIQPETARLKIMEPLILVGDAVKKINIDVTVTGGGLASQAEASRLAIARCLSKLDKKLEEPLEKYDRHLLVADVRRKETHKPNRHGKARAKTQKSYR